MLPQVGYEQLAIEHRDGRAAVADRTSLPPRSAAGAPLRTTAPGRGRGSRAYALPRVSCRSATRAPPSHRGGGKRQADATPPR